MIHSLTHRHGRRSIAGPILVTAIALVLLPGLGRAADAAPTFKLTYALQVDPVEATVTVKGLLEGEGLAGIRAFKNPGLPPGLQIPVTRSDRHYDFRYTLKELQGKFDKVDEAVLARDFFCSFGHRLFLLPDIEGIMDCRDITVHIAVPEGWKTATSQGAGLRMFTCTGVQDLFGTVICTGNYKTTTFDVTHRDPSRKTTVTIALQGQRAIDDARFLADMQRLVEAQVAYFDGKHPVSKQFFAVHFVPPDQRLTVPAFNPRVPSHDTILAFHPSNRKNDNFELLGMLAHEHLHNWYPYVLKTDLGPWFSEGLNDYVAYRGLYAAGIHDAAQFTGMLSKWYREYLICVQRKEQRLMPYRRGMIAGWVMDMEIRRATEGRKGLRDVLARLMTERPASGVVSRADFVAMLEKVSGKDMAGLYQELVEADAVINLPRYLEKSGFHLGDDKVSIKIEPADDAEKAFLKRLMSDGE